MEGEKVRTGISGYLCYSHPLNKDKINILILTMVDEENPSICVYSLFPSFRQWSEFVFVFQVVGMALVGWGAGHP